VTIVSMNPELGVGASKIRLAKSLNISRRGFLLERSSQICKIHHDGFDDFVPWVSPPRGLRKEHQEYVDSSAIDSREVKVIDGSCSRQIGLFRSDD